MRVLAISYLFPNKQYPNHGIFVLNRIKAVSGYCQVKVINPIPWFPFSTRLNRYKNYGRIPEQENMEGIEVYHPRYFSVPRFFKSIEAVSFIISALSVVSKLRKEFDFDLIDLHWTYPDLPCGFFVALYFKKKFFVTIRGKEAFHDQDAGIRKNIVCYLLRKADHVIALSEELQNIALEKGVRIKQTSIIHNGVDTESFYFIGRKTAREQLQLSLKEKIVLVVGSLIYRKGFDRVIRALNEIVIEIPDYRLYIVGSEGPEGDYRTELVKLMNTHNVRDYVRFTGPVDNNQLVYWFNAADFFCLPSRGEGSPNVLTEALACGCPAVTTNVGSVSKIMNADFMGVVVANEDEAVKEGLIQIVKKEYDRQKIAAHMKQYSWDWCARQVVEEYKKVLTNENPLPS